MPNYYCAPVRKGNRWSLPHRIYRKLNAMSDLAFSSPDRNLQNYKPSQFMHSIQPLTFSLSMNHSPIHIAFKITMQIQSISVSESRQKANTFFPNTETLFGTDTFTT